MNRKIAVLPGDGIGPEIIEQAIKILDAIGDRFDHHFTYCYGLVGAIAIDETGSALPQETLDACLESDAVLFGAIGDPKYDNDPNAKVRPEQGLLGLRKYLGLYCNIRPVISFDVLKDQSPLKSHIIKDVNMVIYRELTGGIYFGEKGRKDDGQTAFDTCTYRIDEITRIAQKAFDAAYKRRKKITLIDKANVLETSRLWRETVRVMAADNPEIEVNYMFVDNAAMQMILNPAQFDVILTGNMFGDIISDEASVITGSIGMLPSASIGQETSMFEPIHGSFPQAAGKNVANPLATILSVSMMLEEWGLYRESRCIKDAINYLLHNKFGTEDLNPQFKLTCSQMGDLLTTIIEEEDLSPKKLEKLTERFTTII